MLKKMLFIWKTKNRQVSGRFLNSRRYWQKSPSNILLKSATLQAMKKYARNKIVLDAGAGRLAYRELIISIAKKYISTDFQKTHPDLDLVSDIESLKLKRSCVDVAFCSQVLEHVPHPWLAMKELHRVLKPKGILIVTVPHLAYLHNLPYDFFRYTEGGLRSLSHDAGFRTLKISPLGGFFCFLGYIRSSLLMPLFSIPLIGAIIFYLNYVLSCLEIELDSILRTTSLFPLNHILIAEKKSK